MSKRKAVVQVAPPRKAAATKAANEKRKPASRPLTIVPRAPIRTADAPAAPERVSVAAPPLLKFISREQVLKMVGVSYGTLFGWIREGNFPPARELNSSERASRIYWLEHEVLAWMASRPPRLPRGTRAVYTVEAANK